MNPKAAWDERRREAQSQAWTAKLARNTGRMNLTTTAFFKPEAYRAGPRRFGEPEDPVGLERDRPVDEHADAGDEVKRQEQGQDEEEAVPRRQRPEGLPVGDDEDEDDRPPRPRDNRRGSSGAWGSISSVSEKKP